MIIILKQGTEKEQVQQLSSWLESNANVHVNPIYGSMTTILGLVGDTSSVDMGLIRSNELVEDVKRIKKPIVNFIRMILSLKLANKSWAAVIFR